MKTSYDYKKLITDKKFLFDSIVSSLDSFTDDLENFDNLDDQRRTDALTAFSEKINILFTTFNNSIGARETHQQAQKTM